MIVRLQKEKQAVKQEEKQKYEDEFDEYNKKLQEEREDYRKENPDAAKQLPEDEYVSAEGLILQSDGSSTRMSFELWRLKTNSTHSVTASTGRKRKVF